MAEWIFGLIERAGYLGIFFLTFAETIFPPIPSEVVLPLAGVVAARDHMSLPLVIAAGTAGSMLGNMVWYALAKALGIARFEPFIRRYGRWLTLDWAEIARLEDMFARRGGSIVLWGRMLPMIRMLVSIPAGLMAMPLVPYLFWSTLGASLWTTALTLAGWWLGHEFHAIEVVLGPLSLLVMAGAAIWYVWRVATWRPSA